MLTQTIQQKTKVGVDNTTTQYCSHDTGPTGPGPCWGPGFLFFQFRKFHGGSGGTQEFEVKCSVAKVPPNLENLLIVAEFPRIACIGTEK